MTYVLASDPNVEPPVENEQEKIDELKQVITRIQERNCKPHPLIGARLYGEILTALRCSQQTSPCFPSDTCQNTGDCQGSIDGQQRSA